MIFFRWHCEKGKIIETEKWSVTVWSWRWERLTKGHQRIFFKCLYVWRTEIGHLEMWEGRVRGTCQGNSAKEAVWREEVLQVCHKEYLDITGGGWLRWVTDIGTSVSEGSPDASRDVPANGEIQLLMLSDPRPPAIYFSAGFQITEWGSALGCRNWACRPQGELNQFQVPGGSHKPGRVRVTETVMFRPHLFIGHTRWHVGS